VTAFVGNVIEAVYGAVTEIRPNSSHGGNIITNVLVFKITENNT